MKQNNNITINESDKPQWWQRFSRGLTFRSAPKLKVPGTLRERFQHSELVVRNFPLAFGKALQTGHK